MRASRVIIKKNNQQKNKTPNENKQNEKKKKKNTKKIQKPRPGLRWAEEKRRGLTLISALPG